MPASDEGKRGVTSGPWTVKNAAVFDDNSVYTDVFQTPYGENFVSTTGGRKKTGTRGAVSQQISGLSTSGSYTLRYAYQPYANDVPCTISVKLGAQTIDSFTVATQDGITDHYISRSKTFTPTAGSGALTLQVVCSGGRYFSTNFDNVSLTGP